MNTTQAIDDKLDWLRKRQAQISTLPRQVAEVVSSPAIAPERPVVAPVAPIGSLDHKPRATQSSSFQALQDLGLQGLKTSADDIYLIIAAYCRAGGSAADITRREIQLMYEKRFERRIEASTISPRVNELIAAGRVLQRGFSRTCVVTGKHVFPVYVVAKQTRMAW